VLESSLSLRAVAYLALEILFPLSSDDAVILHAMQSRLQLVVASTTRFQLMFQRQILRRNSVQLALHLFLHSSRVVALYRARLEETDELLDE